MGKHIVFFSGEIEMTAHEYVIVAKCPDCKEIVEVADDDPVLSDATALLIKAWKEAGYIVQQVTQAYVRARYSSRGCTCEKEKPA